MLNQGSHKYLQETIEKSRDLNQQLSEWLYNCSFIQISWII